MSAKYSLREEDFDPGTTINIVLHEPKRDVGRGWRRMRHIDEVTPGHWVRVRVRSRKNIILWEGEVSLLVEMVDYYMILLKGMVEPVTFDSSLGTEVFVIDEDHKERGGRQ